ncbi:MAG TPA: acylphosphatase [Gemmatimonadales bacterium]|nr:acylphosphatase [Gemmatimonadales bacterium]
MTTRRYLLGGLVQGVGFRWFVHRHAARLRLRGWAQNLPDGRVEVVAEGSDETLAELELLLRQGPSQAQVDAVEVTDLPPTAVGRSGFDIR